MQSIAEYSMKKGVTVYAFQSLKLHEVYTADLACIISTGCTAYSLRGNFARRNRKPLLTTNPLLSREHRSGYASTRFNVAALLLHATRILGAPIQLLPLILMISL
jgi:hypothetical protein